VLGNKSIPCSWLEQEYFLVPRVMNREFWIDGQRGWVHKDENVDGGFFHSFDELNLENFDAHKVHLFLPNDYENSGAKYPVIYMNDGHCIFWSGGLGGGSWRVHQTLDELYKNNVIKKVIVVGVVPKERNSEYTHVYWAFEGYRPVWDALPGSTWGGLGYYSYYLTKLKEFIDKHYRTDSSGYSTSIIGASHGGLASFYTAASYPSSFGIAGCMSPSFGAGLDFGGTGGSLKDAPLIQDLKHNLASKVRPRFWFEWGLKRDGGNHNALVERVATDRCKELAWILTDTFHYQENKDLFLREDPWAGHEEEAWAYNFRLFVEIFYRK